MSAKAVFVISDLHLGAVPLETEVAFLRWLAYVKEAGSLLIINGDLFDFWFEYGRVVPAEHVRVLAALADLAESGIPVLFLGGNHDWWGGDQLRSLGIDFSPQPVRQQIQGKSVLIAHGDGLGRGDLGYRIIRPVLRSRLTRWLFRWLHPDLGAWLADRVSGTRRHLARKGKTYPQQTARVAARIKAQADWARAQLASDTSLDMVILGHSHQPVLTEVAPGRFYLNTGDWVDHRSYATIDEAGYPTLHDWDKAW